MKRHAAILALLAGFFLAWPSAGALAKTYSVSDLAGTWQSLALVTGDRPVDEPRVEFGTVAIEASGSASKSYTLLNDIFAEERTDRWNLVMDPDEGLVSQADPDQYTFSYVVSQDENYMAGVDSDSGHRLEVLMRRSPGKVFRYEDLLGTWYYQSVTSGDSAWGEVPRLAHGTVEFVAAAGANAYTAVLDGMETNDARIDPTAFVESLYPLTMDANGIVTWPDSDTFMRWVLSDDKNVLVGIRLYGGNQFEILIRKDAAVQFGVADTAGMWYSQAVVAGDDDANATLYWDEGVINIGENGTGKAQWNRSYGDTFIVGASMAAINAEGQLLDPESPDFYFTMAPDKRFMAGSKFGSNIDGQSGGFRMEVLFRHDPLADPPFEPKNGGGGGGTCFISGALDGR